MSVGLMMLPAISARHWAATLPGQVRVGVQIAVLASWLGLLVSYHADIPAGPAIVLSAGAIWLGGLLLGRHDSLRTRIIR